ncbi:hypothetical protein BCR44DRAFT_1434078 [Catenaria anguillulae PL171]|uniref:Uncharacterized protein n=1 Tax=Catenaria anguillulae PL171 TaxID=765915 RepID=A0A1Y2HL94_9FUNG|nr:hypothetical protein BCR44DRAFT_1434078 [Catenaria anguillulae PL171]
MIWMTCCGADSHRSACSRGEWGVMVDCVIALATVDDGLCVLCVSSFIYFPQLSSCSQPLDLCRFHFVSPRDMLSLLVLTLSKSCTSANFTYTLSHPNQTDFLTTNLGNLQEHTSTLNVRIPALGGSCSSSQVFDNMATDTVWANSIHFTHGRLVSLVGADTVIKVVHEVGNEFAGDPPSNARPILGIGPTCTVRDAQKTSVHVCLQVVWHHLERIRDCFCLCCKNHSFCLDCSVV